MLRAEIKSAVQKAVREALGDAHLPDFSVAAPENPEHGDYATNAAFVLAHAVKKPPMEVAQLLVDKLTTYNLQLTAKIKAVPPGFINFWIGDNYLLKKLSDILENLEGWGKNDAGHGKTAVVEYFQLNIAKRPHVGHLRSAVIGDAIKRMLQFSGYSAVSDTHVGDWGTQFGIFLLGRKNVRIPAEELSDTEDNFEIFERIYQDEVKRIEKNPERRDMAKEEFAKLERGDPENRKLWEEAVAMSMGQLKRSAERLGLLEFDEHRGESAYEEAMPKITALALKKGIAKKADDGAVVVDLSSEKLDEAVLVKSDGASTYLLRDLATIQYRKEQYAFWKNLYVVDVRQEHHFRQVFRVAELLGFEGAGESEHIAFGFMSLPEGAMSTRAGTAISLDAVLDEAEKKARAVIKEKNPELENAEAVARVVGIGALKYFDLSHHRKSDIVFKWDEALSFEGNTGPYLQYTHARLKSILRKAENVARVATEVSGLDETEHRLLVSLLRFPEALEDALVGFTPSTLANYLYALAQTANEFYHSHPVLQEEDPGKRGLRLSLVVASAATLKNGLWCLGIEAPEEM